MTVRGGVAPAADRLNYGVLAGFSPSIPFIQLFPRRNLARDVHDNGVPLPALHQLLLAKIAIEELFDKLDAAVLEELHIRLQPAIEGHRDLPRPREDFRIFDRHFVADGVRRDRREAFDQMQGITME